MHISQAKPAERFYRIPMAAHRALLADDCTGKGHALTLMLLASFLWSTEPVDGTRSDWADILGISAQTFEAHVPQLGGWVFVVHPVPLRLLCVYGLTRKMIRKRRQSGRRGSGRDGVRGEWGFRKQRYVWITQRVEALRSA